MSDEQATQGAVIRDQSADRKYFTITPRIVIAYARNPYDLALWTTVKDVAGESGECYLATPELAALSGMSTGQVSLSRAYWIKIGFLQGEVRRDLGYPQPVWHLTIPDLWERNISWCLEHPKISDRIAFMAANRSLHVVKASSGEGGGSPGETKKNNKDQEYIKERTALLAKLYSENIGALIPLIADALKDAAVEFPDQTWYEPAFKLAVGKNARNWRYVYTVLKNWKDHGLDWTPDGGRGKKSKKVEQEGVAATTEELTAGLKIDWDAIQAKAAENAQREMEKTHG